MSSYESTQHFNSLRVPYGHLDFCINNISSFCLAMEVLVVKFGYRDNEDKIFLATLHDYIHRLTLTINLDIYLHWKI